MIILDIEWNRGYDKTPLDEILQIGAVRVEALGGPAVSTFNAYIRPSVHKRFDRGARSLPELQTSRESSLDFVTAFERFRAWCGSETVFASWGGGDLDTLTNNCRFWNIPPLHMETVYNFQLALAYLLGTEQQIALWRAVDYLQIPDSFTFHNALNDAIYTALIGRWLTPEALEYTPLPKIKKPRRRISLKLSAFPFVRPPEQDVGPEPSPERILDERTTRSPACPVCGLKGCVTHWRFAVPPDAAGPQQCFSVFSCPHHGRFLCALTLSRRADGSWHGQRSIPVITPQVVQDYIAACKGCVHQCTSGTQKRRWHRKKSRSSASSTPS